jgi:hypothetical protein
MFRIIYITGAVAGLLFPVMEELALRFSKRYMELDKTPENKYVRLYREGPVHYKIIAALIPIFNIIWILTVLLLMRFFIQNWWFSRKKKFIWWLAGTSIKKHFIFKAKLVKKFFPAYKDYYYNSLEKRHWNYKMAKEIERILIADIKKTRETEKIEADGTENKA